MSNDNDTIFLGTMCQIQCHYNYSIPYKKPYLQAFCLGCRRYHVPRSWLKPTNNLIIVFEELGGNPWKISLVKRTVHTAGVRD